MVGAWFRRGDVPSPTGWQTQPLPCGTARCGLANPQHRGIISCFLKQVLRHRSKNSNWRSPTHKSDWSGVDLTDSLQSVIDADDGSVPLDSVP